MSLPRLFRWKVFLTDADVEAAESLAKQLQLPRRKFWQGSCAVNVGNLRKYEKGGKAGANLPRFPFKLRVNRGPFVVNVWFVLRCGPGMKTGLPSSQDRTGFG